MVHEIVSGIIRGFIIKPVIAVITYVIGALMWLMPHAVYEYFASAPKRVLSFLFLMFIFIRAFNFALSLIAKIFNIDIEQFDELKYVISFRLSANKKIALRDADIFAGYIAGSLDRIMNIPNLAETVMPEPKNSFFMRLKKLFFSLLLLYLLTEFIITLTAAM